MSEKPPPRLLDQLRAKARLLHYSLRTEDAYADWVKRFILFHGKRHPREMGAAEVEAFRKDWSTSPRRQDAVERLADRLLASPRYGERWARHWLDVVHFGESNGFGMDRPVGECFRAPPPTRAGPRRESASPFAGRPPIASVRPVASPSEVRRAARNSSICSQYAFLTAGRFSIYWTRVPCVIIGFRIVHPFAIRRRSLRPARFLVDSRRRPPRPRRRHRRRPRHQLRPRVVRLDQRQHLGPVDRLLLDQLLPPAPPAHRAGRPAGRGPRPRSPR